MKSLSVVIPCFNESAVIPRFESELFPALEDLGLNYEVVAVDDGSTDQTRGALEELSKTRSYLKVISHERNRGLGAALRTGFKAATKDWIATLDADLTFHPDFLQALISEQTRTGADLISGSPFLRAQDCSVPMIRKIPSFLLNSFYRGLFTRALTSYTPIFRLYRASMLRTLPLTAEGFEINAEIAARVHLAEGKFAEVPVPLTTRREGESKLERFRELKRHAALIVKLLSGR